MRGLYGFWESLLSHDVVGHCVSLLLSGELLMELMKLIEEALGVMMRDPLFRR